MTDQWILGDIRYDAAEPMHSPNCDRIVLNTQTLVEKKYVLDGVLTNMVSTKDAGLGYKRTVLRGHSRKGGM